MARDESPPFSRGETWYNGETIDANNLGGLNLEGKEYVFEDTAPSNMFTSRGLGFPVHVRVVRNASGGALLPKRLVKLDAAGYYGRRASGYANVTAEGPVYPVDEFLPAAGVPDKDLFYVVISGPALVKTSLAGNAENFFAVGDRLVALTAATSGATTAGRVAPASLTGATQVLADAVGNYIGRALSAATTANTNSDVLVLVGQR
jgi:hypothetical protein